MRDVRLTSHTVEVFYSGERIASHVRKHGNPGQYSTLDDHMPPNHLQYAQWNAERFRSWARGIGPNTLVVVNAIFSSRKIEQHVPARRRATGGRFAKQTTEVCSTHQ